MPRQVEVVSKPEGALILTTRQKARMSEIATAIPKGYRCAEPDDVILRAILDLNYRDELIKYGPVWTFKRGLKSRGHYKITVHENSLEFKHIPDARLGGFRDLKMEQKSFHRPGKGTVVVGFEKFRHGPGITVRADYSDVKTVRFRVAIGKADESFKIIPTLKEDKLMIDEPERRSDARKELRDAINKLLRKDVDKNAKIDSLKILRKAIDSVQKSDKY